MSCRSVFRLLPIMLGALLILSSSMLESNSSVTAKAATQGGCRVLYATQSETEGCSNVRLIIGCDCNYDLVPSCGSYNFCSISVCDVGFAITVSEFCF